jgi:vitamin B12 transporter
MAAASLTAIPAYAQTSNELEPVIVTAMRTAQTADQTIASVSVLNRIDIERSGAKSISELFHALPGINSVSNGTYGSPSSVYVRGTNTNHVLLLIDGVKFGSATTGYPAWEHIPIEHIEKIEIVRGPRASLYGSQAMGGVIQIFTKKYSGIAQKEISVDFGSEGFRKATAGLNGSHENIDYSVKISASESNGWSTTNPSHPWGIYESDSDPYESTAVSANLGIHLTPSSKLSLQLLNAEDESTYDNYGTNPKVNAAQKLFAINLETDSNGIHSKLNLALSKDLYDDTDYGHTNTARRTFSYEATSELSSVTSLTGGFDRIESEIDTRDEYDKSKNHENAIFAQLQTSYSGNNLIVAGRAIDNAQFGSDTTYDLALSRQLNPYTRIRASIGTAYAAPSFNASAKALDSSTYGVYTYNYYSNPDLKPETSRSREIGVDLKINNTSNLALNLYETNIKNLIENSESISGNTYTYIQTNLGSAKIQGLEIIGKTSILSWDLSGNISFINAKSKSGDTLGMDLKQRPDTTFRIDANRSFQDMNFSLSWHGQNHSFDNPSNSRRIAGFGLLDARLEKKISENTRINFGGTNLLDKKYETVSGYNMPPRQLGLGLHAKF